MCKYIEKDRGRRLGYINKPCIRCGRYRVERYENGEMICEKCLTNQGTGEYENDLDV